MSPVTRTSPAKPEIGLPPFMAIFPKGSVVGRLPRTSPIGWLCEAGHRHVTRECAAVTK